MAKKSAQKKSVPQKPVVTKAPEAEISETVETASMDSVLASDESVQHTTTEHAPIDEKNGTDEASDEKEQAKTSNEPRDMLVQVRETEKISVIRKSEYDSNKHVAL